MSSTWLTREVVAAVALDPRAIRQPHLCSSRRAIAAHPSCIFSASPAHRRLAVSQARRLPQRLSAGARFMSRDPLSRPGGMLTRFQE